MFSHLRNVPACAGLMNEQKAQAIDLPHSASLWYADKQKKPKCLTLMHTEHTQTSQRLMKSVVTIQPTKYVQSLHL